MFNSLVNSLLTFNIVYVYSFLSILSVFIIFTRNKILKIASDIVFILSFYFFIGLGVKIGVDWVEYKRIFYQLSDKEGSYELGFILLTKFINFIGFSFWQYYLFIKLTTVTLIIVFIKKYSSLPIFTFTLVVGFLFPFINDPIRQLLALDLLLISIVLFHRLPGVALILLGSMFHTSFISLIFARVLRVLNIKLVLIAAVFIGGTLSFLFDAVHYLYNVNFLGMGYVYSKLIYYESYSMTGNLFAFLIRVSMLLFLVTSEKVKVTNILYFKNENIFYVFYSLTLFMLLSEIVFFTIPIVPQRLRLYLIFFPLVLLSNYIYLNIKSVSVFIFTMILIMYCLASLWLFSSLSIGEFYTLDNNFFIRGFIGNDVNAESSVDNFWLDTKYKNMERASE